MTDWRTRLLWLVLCAAPACVSPVGDHCPACTIVKEKQRPQPPVTTRDTRALVVLVHGAFGFGSEWAKVVAALKQAPHVSFVVFSWRGPFHELTGAVVDLGEIVQHALDQSPDLSEVLLLAHSAGGPLATRAALRLKVPSGRHVEVVEIDSPTFLNGRPFFRDRILLWPELPPNVERAVYLARKPPQKGPVDARPIYLGSTVTHDQSVALVGVPLVAQLAARALAK